ncbi:tRNA pseudouridine(13) synthase TruD [Pseudidiomarina sp. 1APP75-32.1]|uniref:tRNA pseudouridine synthase D n=1 Tax=Pseudidiomarina terrestris TaxID=2820060 RepID=A0AAW7QV29_9GAMM|nr:MULTISPECIES: tRNA pseudouridine(13) synthase TruD [unclassified Pseudidiomarina]MDN7123599.1 tRNA pseudouridine(13) synthase TruD [Pseudidiomarina sp. 1APP75-32.1]MDN7128677.1 tRNA pseudouridine(13) synthase TruD [Pseudidiomarina sp. 1APR75-15]MDN7137735.1 tRNA pseudouridine(13) synthase TruD [Pseudidiomarina sp. 1ASP75-14]
MTSNALTELAYWHGQPQTTGKYRQSHEDFQVIEQLEVGADEPGEHQWLWVYKNGANTNFVARQLADFAGVSERQVSYSGLKDRHAETWQWFSVQLPGQELLDWSQLEHPEFRVERAVRQTKKLKQGYHSGNTFVLRVRDVSDMAQLRERWQQVVELGVPNYFGEQRFGHDGQNLAKARAWLTGELSRKQVRKWSRQQQGMLLSTARSYLFNNIVSARIAADRMKPEQGDFMILSGSRSFFQIDALDEELLTRWRTGDILLSAPLAGSWPEPRSSHLTDFEFALLQEDAELVAGLKAQRVDLARRAILLKPAAASMEELDERNAELRFTLPTGSFATSLLRELLNTDATT